MARHPWHPRTERPPGLVSPVRLDREGASGPTRGQARGPRWRRVARGWYVPAEVDGSVVEQRILEQSVRLPPGGAVTAWAALRWRGGTFFDGRTQGGQVELPVPLILGTDECIRRTPASSRSLERFYHWEREVIHGLPCAVAERAVWDEMRRTRDVRDGVVAVDMAIAADLVELPAMTAYVAERPAWTGVPLAREILPLVDGDSRSPMESRMRLVWLLDAALPPPLCNKPVFDLSGNLLGYPDLLDEAAGVVGEYQGADHKEGARHRRDVQREDRFRDHGLEYFEVVGGDLHDRDLVVRRMLGARSRARWLPAGQRRWTLEAPLWWRWAEEEGA